MPRRKPRPLPLFWMNTDKPWGPETQAADVSDESLVVYNVDAFFFQIRSKALMMTAVYEGESTVAPVRVIGGELLLLLGFRMMLIQLSWVTYN